jgi:hypothetical protein
MIALDLNLPPVRVNAAERTVDVAPAQDASGSDIRPLGRGVASNPITEWLAVGPQLQATASDIKFRLPDLQWTSAHEQKFAVLAGKEAVGELGVGERLELEHLSTLRRSTKNPRLGEEVVWEYEQRELTRDLIKALDRYVSFHKAAHRP